MYLLLALLAVQQPVSPPSSPVSDTAHVVIVATTDVHGRVLGWDFGPAVLARATGDATYHYVSANIFKGASDTLVYPSHVVVTRAGVKIGITGLTTPGVMVWDRSRLGAGIRVRPIAEAAPLALRRLDLEIGRAHV